MPESTVPPMHSPAPTDRRVGAVVAVKALERAKTRITADQGFRRDLTWAMLLDTVAALLPAVDRVLVVGAQLPTGSPAQYLPDPGIDLNAAFVAGAQQLVSEGIGDVLAVVADLPTLRSASVGAFTRSAPERSRLFLRDAVGAGTTMLLGRDLARGQDLTPGFEGHSADQHLASGAVDPAPQSWPDARLDVDTLADLERARSMGLGAKTAGLLRRLDQLRSGRSSG